MRDTDRWFAWLPDRIICNSAAIAARFAGSRWQDRVATIMNGVDLAEYRPELSGAAVRTELGWTDQPIIAAISRLDPRRDTTCCWRRCAVSRPVAPRHAW